MGQQSQRRVKCKCVVGWRDVGGIREAQGVGRGLNVIVEGVEFQCHVFPFPVYMCLCGE